MAFFIETEQNIFKFVCNHKRPQISNAILRKKNKARNITCPNSKLHYKAIVITTVWHRQKKIKKKERKKRKTYRPMESNCESRNKPTYLWATNL